MPRANSRPEVLVRREHIRECHRFHFRQLAFGVRRLNSFGNLVWCLAFHSELGAQLLQRQNGAATDGIEAEGSAELCVVPEVPEPCGSHPRPPPAPPYHAPEALAPLRSTPHP